MNLLLCLLFLGDPVTVPAGDVIVLESKEPSQWGIHPPSKTFFTMEGGKKFVAGSGKYAGKFVVYRSILDGGDKLDVTEVTVVDDGGNPPNNDPPNNDPPSDKPLSEQVKEWMQTVPVDARDSTMGVVESMTNTANAAKDGKFSTIHEMASALNASIGLVIKDLAAWKMFSIQFEAYVKSKNPQTPNELGEILLQIAGYMTTN